MRSTTPEDLDGFCPTCLFKSPWCMCAFLPKLHTHTRFLIVRHRKERYKTSNTGRIASLSLSNQELLEYGMRDAAFDPTPLSRPGTYLLFPAVDEVSNPTTPPEQLVVLDGTWRQARRMFRRNRAFSSLPRIALPTPTSFPERIRKPPFEWQLSTIEAIARAIEHFEDPDKAQVLDQTFARMVLHYRLQREQQPLPKPS